jgi:hypothetical protein
MSTYTRDQLLRQFRTASALLHHHLDSLTTDECLWRPAAKGLHVYEAEGGRWIADWPDREDYDLGPPSAAWTTWHIGYWWSMVLDHSFGQRSLTREEVCWPGDAPAAVSWIKGLERQWLEAVGGLDDRQLAAADLTRWPYTRRPFGDVVGWVTVELTKNAAEIGMVRFLIWRP